MPKHKFIVWLAVQNRLQTTARLYRYGVSQSANCLICGSDEETDKHLFFQCHYSSESLKCLKNWLGIRSEEQDLQQMYKKVQRGSISKFQKQVILASLAALCYSIWQGRNSVYWHQCLPSIAMVVKQCKYIVRSRVLAVVPRSITRQDQSWLSKL